MSPVLVSSSARLFSTFVLAGGLAFGLAAPVAADPSPSQAQSALANAPAEQLDWRPREADSRLGTAHVVPIGPPEEGVPLGYRFRGEGWSAVLCRGASDAFGLHEVVVEEPIDALDLPVSLGDQRLFVAATLGLDGEEDVLRLPKSTGGTEVELFFEHDLLDAIRWRFAGSESSRCLPASSPDEE